MVRFDKILKTEISEEILKKNRNFSNNYNIIQ